MHLYQFLHHLKPTVNYAVSELHHCITYFAKKHINFIFRKNDSESLKKVFLLWPHNLMREILSDFQGKMSERFMVKLNFTSLSNI